MKKLLVLVISLFVFVVKSQLSPLDSFHSAISLAKERKGTKSKATCSCVTTQEQTSWKSSLHNGACSYL